MKKSALLICLLAELGASAFAANEPASATLAEKMDQIIFPSIKFENATRDEAVEYLRIKSRDLDSHETHRKRKGVNMLVRNAEDKLISLDLKAVSLKAALNRVAELTGCSYRIEDQEVVVESRTFQSRREILKSPAKATTKTPAKIQLSIQVAELADAKDMFLPQREDISEPKPKPATPGFTLYGIVTEAHRQEIMRGLAQRKHVTLHAPDCKVVQDESTTSFPPKGALSTMKVTVQAYTDAHHALDLDMEFSKPTDNRSISTVASLWSGQTVVLEGAADHSPRAFVFISASLLDAAGKPMVKP